MSTRRSWEDLAGLSLARQFPPGHVDVAETVARIGAVQSQTARSPFLCLAARRPGTTHAEVTAAYEAGEIVRGSTIRGTVHTAVPVHFLELGEVTRVAQRRTWERPLRSSSVAPEELWARLESFAAEEWRTPVELFDELLRVLAERGEQAAVDRLDTQFGRYLAFGHGGLVRRPRKGGWEGQGAPGYRGVTALLGLDRPSRDAALLDAVRLHVRCHGPVSRRDIAWWSGLRLGTVDELVERLGDELTAVPGPDGRTYLDVRDAPPAADLPGVRLLPEFDALLCGYDSKARDRFVSPEHNDVLWARANGMVLPPLLVDGRITGYWRATGSARRRPLEVVWFAGTRRPRKAELEEPVAALEAALGITVTGVAVTRASA